MNSYLPNLYDAFAALGFLVLMYVALLCLVRIFYIFAYTIRDTIKWPFNYKLPFVFIGNLWEQILAWWNGQEVVCRPLNKKD